MLSKNSSEFLEKLIEELRRKSMSLPSQLERITRVNPQIETLARKVQLNFKTDDESKKIIAALYHLMRLNEVIDEQYGFEDFVKDINILFEILLPKSSVLTKDTVFQISDLYLKLFLDSAIISYATFIRLINEKGKELSDNVIKALLIREEILDTFLLIISSFEDLNRDLDLRFFVAAVRYRFLYSLYRMKRSIEQRKIEEWKRGREGKEWLRIVGDEPPKLVDIELRPIHKIYEEIKKEYPIRSGDDVFYDILFFEIISPIYNIMVKIAADAIQEKRKEITSLTSSGLSLQRQIAARTEFKADETSMPRMNLELMIDSAFRITGELTERNKSAIRHTIDTLLRRRMLKLYGQLYIPDMSKLLDVAFEEVYHLLLSEPYIALSVLSPEEINIFMENPKEYVKSKRNTLWELFKRKFRAYVGVNISYFTIAEALVKIIDEALQRYNRIFKHK